MTPEMAIMIAQLLIKYGPTVAAGIAKIFSAPTHTLQDWNDIFATVKTSDQMIADAQARAKA